MRRIDVPKKIETPGQPCRAVLSRRNGTEARKVRSALAASRRANYFLAFFLAVFFLAAFLTAFLAAFLAGFFAAFFATFFLATTRSPN